MVMELAFRFKSLLAFWIIARMWSVFGVDATVRVKHVLGLEFLAAIRVQARVWSLITVHALMSDKITYATKLLITPWMRARKGFLTRMGAGMQDKVCFSDEYLAAVRFHACVCFAADVDALMLLKHCSALETPHTSHESTCKRFLPIVSEFMHGEIAFLLIRLPAIWFSTYEPSPCPTGVNDLMFS